MAVYSISYDLRAPGKNYDDLYTAIKNLGNIQHPLESNWFVSSDTLTPHIIYNKLKPCIDSNDHIFIQKVERGNSGWMQTDFINWLNANI